METAIVVDTNEDFLWQNCIAHLEGKLTTPVFESWIKPMRVYRLSADEITLMVPTPFHKEWAENRLKTTILGTLTELLGAPINIKFMIDPDAPPPEQRTGSAERTGTPAAFTAVDDFRQTGLNTRYTFEQFVVGATNRFAHAAAQAVADAPARAYNPLFIYGAVGLGKTHLMHAIGHRVLLCDPRARVVYVSSETFTNEFITAIKNNQTVEFRNRYRTVDVLLIDDIQFLEGKEQTQE